MEVKTKKSSSDSLLSCGCGGGLGETLLIKPKSSRCLQTERVPRSSVLERLQTFLPQMAEANRSLQQQMEEAPEGHFDVENVEAAERVIEMDVALVELGGSDSDSDEDSETSGEESPTEITEENLKLPGNRNQKRANIQVLESKGE